LKITIKKTDQEEVVLPFIEYAQVDVRGSLGVAIEVYDEEEKLQLLPADQWQRVTIEK